MDSRYFSDKVVKWYLQNQRDLPWRQTRDAYRIWLSEIILQQTRVSQGLPYYLRFVDSYPTVEALANASEQSVLRLWQGLGYYTRARNLHKCAKVVATTYAGKFPNNFEALKKLPGIGDYTAAAIASICFKEPVAVIDGNVFRVLSRIYGIETAINSPAGKKEFTDLGNKLILDQSPDIYNQAVMEFGALHCTPKNPKCGECPFQSKCVAAINSLQDKLPVKIKGKPVRKRYFNYIVVRKGNSLLMRRRDQKDIWHGLFDFYMVETNRQTAFSKILSADKYLSKYLSREDKTEMVKKFKHVLTHQIIISTFTVVEKRGVPWDKDLKMKFFNRKQIAALPKPVLISKFLDEYQLL
ncbi:A/G-specific adenine glycosylase [Pseudochryseolinea flava]|uniref:Adenine DNA glycosylase n=1 Tax=Pseudochryseolinea flava TaxID=2059302 RepID=A0A364YAS5_9BACT|nr:A/G-specific adenine glycosylase [Pseudochryseolinea flava]RAW03232.1 A/G-specific adenine glycosylase [Pseudochryseolinea flava]